MTTAPTPWGEAMERALYGADGFYRREAPARHFRTSATAGPLLAEALLTLAVRVAGALGADRLTVVDMGAGDGRLLTRLAEAAPPSWRLVAVDLRPRPPRLPARVEWAAEPPPTDVALLVAHEWLDNIPVDLAQLVRGRWHQVFVDPAGRESCGPPVSGRVAAWLDRWSPPDLAQDGERVDVGWRRDAAWAALLASCRRGVALCVDYAADPDVRTSTLSGYRLGRAVPPVPDGSCDLTANVRFDAVQSVGEECAAGSSLLLSQRQALLALGIDGRRPRAGSAGYAQALQRASQAAELLDRGGLGGFTWLLQGRGVDVRSLVQPPDGDAAHPLGR